MTNYNQSIVEEVMVVVVSVGLKTAAWVNEQIRPGLEVELLITPFQLPGCSSSTDEGKHTRTNWAGVGVGNRFNNHNDQVPAFANAISAVRKAQAIVKNGI